MHTMRCIKNVASAFGLTSIILLSAIPSFAAPVDDKIDQLEAQMQSLNAELQALKSQQQEKAAQTPPSKSSNEAEPRETASDLDHWRGFYAGGSVDLAQQIVTGTYNSTTSDQSSRYTDGYGLVAGYNWLNKDGLLYGVEADVNYSGAENNNNANRDTIWQGYSTLRGRIGYAKERALIFITGGLAITDIVNHSDIFGATTTHLQSPTINVGAALGAGAEFAITDHIGATAQYLRLEVPGQSQSVLNSGVPYERRFSYSANIIRFGLNWHF